MKPNMSPLEIRILLACFYSPDPEAEFSGDQWNSESSQRALIRFKSEDILRANLTLTDRGVALVDELCNTPFPTAIWHFERS